MMKLVSTALKLIGFFVVCVILSQAPINGRPISTYFRQIFNNPVVQKTTKWVYSKVDIREHFADQNHSTKMSGLLKKNPSDDAAENSDESVNMGGDDESDESHED